MIAMMKKQKVSMGDDASTAADVKPPASATAATVAANSVDVASVRDLDALTLAAPHVDAAKLLEIITELRQTAGASMSLLPHCAGPRSLIALNVCSYLTDCVRIVVYCRDGEHCDRQGDAPGPE